MVTTIPTKGEEAHERRPATAKAIFPGRLTISVDEFAQATGVGRSLIYRAVKRKEIPSGKIGERVVIPVAALDRWLGVIVG